LALISSLLELFYRDLNSLQLAFLKNILALKITNIQINETVLVLGTVVHQTYLKEELRMSWPRNFEGRLFDVL